MLENNWEDDSKLKKKSHCFFISSCQLRLLWYPHINMHTYFAQMQNSNPDAGDKG